MNLQINGYTINSKISTIKDLLDIMVNRGVFAHTKSQAKAILRLMRYLGVKHLSHFTNSNVLEMNVPAKAEANRIYCINFSGDIPVVGVYCNSVKPLYSIPVDELIISKSLGNWIQDM